MAKPASALTRSVTEEVRRIVAGEPDAATLTAALRYLAKWRSQLVFNTIEMRSGSRVLTGPFAGMDYAVAASEGSRASRLVGSYEAGLAPILEEIIARDYQVVIDVGCAEGYVAVGMALRMPDARVLARDTDMKARVLCAALAQRNGVGGRVEVGGAMSHADFALCETQRCVVICDIEGAEADLIDPARAPGLLAADILVEVHDCFRPGLSAEIATRFSETHKITRIGRKIDGDLLPDWMEELSDLDRLIALWEWRTGPTPWLWMEKQ